jgi:hypothetical protein
MTLVTRGEAVDNTPHLFMPDGQLKSHVVRLYLTENISLAQKPTLQLLRSHAVTKEAIGEKALLEPAIVASGQEWVERFNGQDVRRSGTLLLFDLAPVKFPYKAMVRITPVLMWENGGVKQFAVGSREVNLGNIIAAIGWTLVVVGIAVLAVLVLAWRVAGNPLLLLTGTDGHLSLAQTQVAVWTLAVGGVVLAYGMIRLDVPEIPTSLVVLMGASLATGGVGYFRDAQKQGAAPPGTVVSRTPALPDLLQTFAPGQPPELSLAKAQMLFWTALLLVLFVSKSVLDGVIWDVPWPLVALMGFSQAGYLAPKLVP